MRAVVIIFLVPTILFAMEENKGKKVRFIQVKILENGIYAQPHYNPIKNYLSLHIYNKNSLISHIGEIPISSLFTEKDSLTSRICRLRFALNDDFLLFTACQKKKKNNVFTGFALWDIAKNELKKSGVYLSPHTIKKMEIKKNDNDEVVISAKTNDSANNTIHVEYRL